MEPVVYKVEYSMSVGEYLLNVKSDYGAKGNGINDDTSRLQNALNDAATLVGATVFFPYGLYMISQPLYVYGNINIQGVGMDAATIQAFPGLNNWMVIYQAAPTPNTFTLGSRNGMGRLALELAPTKNGVGRMRVLDRYPALFSRVSDITFNQNCANQSAGGCIYAPGVARSVFDHVHFMQGYDAGLWLDSPGPSVPGQNKVTDCLFDYGFYSAGNGQGLRMTSSIANSVNACSFNFNGGAGASNWNVQDSAGQNFFTNCNFSGGTGDGIHVLTGADEDRITACSFQNVGQNSIYMGAQHSGMTNNIFRDGGAASFGNCSHIVLANNFNAVSDNTFWSSARQSQLRSFVREMTGVISSIIGPNHTFASPFSGLATSMIEFAGGTSTRIFQNPGFNPIGPNMTQPAMPLSTVVVNNTFGFDAMVVITGGAVNSISIAGTVTGATSGTFRVLVGESIAINYTSAPTWKWFGD